MAKQRFDLGASFARLSQAINEAETPILEAHGLQMWDYVVLSALEHGTTPKQSHLAQAVRRDQTRLIQNLDRLQERGLIGRSPDPADRRNRIIELTDAGRRLLVTCQTDVRAMEARLLAPLTARQRVTFIGMLETLAASVSTDPRER